MLKLVKLNFQSWGRFFQKGPLLESRRGYVHFQRSKPHDFELPLDTMPKDIDTLMNSDPQKMDYFGSYWYWRIRGESTLMDTDTLPQKSYKQLARDLGMQIVSEPSEHMLGLLELYEYLKTSPFVGPFGTIQNPVLVPSVMTERYSVSYTIFLLQSTLFILQDWILQSFINNYC